ncbi:MAG: hypothetical protein M3R51_00300 [Candidatus Eremiobacteraeota bacterium]|nr:hypothetical protein [Candidatus Eremiobacteraeota bacterium]
MQRRTRGTIHVQLGYDAGADGGGIVYARLRSAAGERLVRAAFHVKRLTGTEGRENGYGALTAIALLLRERGIESIHLKLSDGALLEDIATHRSVPAALVLPYVRLHCALNRFASFSVSAGEEDEDLAQRARAEVALHIAA